ncbi:MAG TPA: twin-arginine translocase TatA/TatE family subunit [Bryobacteraceae bacterium]
MGPLGMQEIMLIFLLALLLFGPKKLPELGKLLGKGLTEFRRAKSELTSTFESHLHELERETRLDTTPSSSTPDYSSPHDPYPYDEYGQSDSSYGSTDSSSTDSSNHESHETAPSYETAVSEPPTASATATQDAEANREHAASISSPVAGTVPRSNGSQSVESLSATAKEEHPA